MKLLNGKRTCLNPTSLSIVFLLALTSPLVLTIQVLAQDALVTRTTLQTIAGVVMRDATLDFVDEKSGQRFKSPDNAPIDASLQPGSRYNDWRYWNGVLNLAMFRLGDELKNPAYSEFPERQVAFCFDYYRYFEKAHINESKWERPFGQMFKTEELDDCGAMGASLIEVVRRDPQARYRAYIDSTARYILERQIRLSDGTLVRSFPEKWTIWSDDLYMSISFLARMGELSGDRRYFDDAAKQVLNFHKYLFDQNKGMMRHCWYSDIQRQGVAFWGRGNGWAMLAQVELLDRLPEHFVLRDSLIVLLRRHIFGIAEYQSSSGLWHQLIDKGDSYLETSCTAMFTYSIARAVNKGYIPSRYATIARRGWEGVRTRIGSDGQIAGVCTGTGVADDLVSYYTRPAPSNDVHGIGAVILAGVEVLNLSR
jgi:unsaturated rhamnogalacturonyl hydrolase